MSNYMSELRQKLVEINNIQSASAVLAWDQQTYMPKKGVELRSMQSSTLRGLSHKMLVSEEMGTLLNKLKEDKEYSKLSDNDKTIVDRVYEGYEKVKKVPNKLVMEIAKEGSDAHTAWEEARMKSDYGLFAPHLKKMVDYSKKLADLYGYEKSPYDALIDQHERKMTVEELDPMFENLKGKIVPFLDAIKNSNVKTSDALLRKNYDPQKQWDMTIEALKIIGYDFDRGRQDKAVHPFTIGFGPTDVRVTTRIIENYLGDALGGTIHEGGHALYEQGFSMEYYGTPLAEAASTGVHESQSRLWENIVGRSRAFWKFFYPKLKAFFPDILKDISMDEFYMAYNHVEPGFIRVGSDEVTYNLHILLRYEIERDVIEGKTKVEDLRDIWNSKMKEYLGIEPKDDKEGILQDVHWTQPMGYFPTYTIGNLFSAQIYHKALEDNPNLDKEFEEGNFTTLLNWLRENVHKHGQKYYPKDLIKVATGEEPNPDYFTNYIYDRYGEIYEIARMMM